MEKTKMLFAITVRGFGRSWIDELKKDRIKCHLQFSGKGTASSDMMDILGLDNNDKDIVISFGSETAVNLLALKLTENVKSISSAKGIMMIIPMEAVNNIIAIMASRETESVDKQGVKKMAKSEFEYSLILVTVNQGYTDAVMQTAKKAGATGGTVVRARLADSENTEELYGISMQEEREIVAIMAPGTTRNAIMEAVNGEFGLRSKAQGIICSLPVDKAFKL